MGKNYLHSRALRLITLTIDILLIGALFKILSHFLYFSNQHNSNLFLVIFILTWLIAALINRSYYFFEHWSFKRTLKNLTGSFLLQMPILALALFIIGIHSASRLFMGVFYFTAFLTLANSRLLYKFIFKYIEFSGSETRKVVIIGTRKSALALFDFFTKSTPSSYKFLGFFDDDPSHRIEEHHYRGNLKSLKRYCLDNDVDEIYFAASNLSEERMYDIRDFADKNTIYFRIAPDFGSVMSENYQVYLYDSIPVMTTRRDPLDSTINQYLKRVFDVIFSVTVIALILSWLYPLIGILIKLESKGPILFKQLRPGKKNKLFECYKFRTMRVNATPELQATKDDPRITKIGRILRKTSLDEFPQFFNVLLGSMSIVGPRPHATAQLDQYAHLLHSMKTRHFVVPGITGYAQVNGFRGDTSSPDLMAKRIDYDFKYIENWSLMLDIRIIALTVWNVFKGEKEAY